MNALKPFSEGSESEAFLIKILSSDRFARPNFDEIRTDLLFEKLNWAQIEAQSIDAPIIATTRESKLGLRLVFLLTPTLSA